MKIAGRGYDKRMQVEADAPVISTRGLSKRYGRVEALRSLDLDVHRGEILGFLGLNGAGKTTTIRLLLDLIKPSAGRAFVFGSDCQSQGLEVRAQVGYLPGELGLYGDMTGLQVLDLLSRLGRTRTRGNYRNELLERFELPLSDLQRRLRDYSTGMRRKLGLIQAFEAEPPLLILDEPTEGLDPLMQESFYDLLSEVRNRGRTVFMSSHVLSEVERVCNRIALIRKGELVLLSPMEEVRKLAPRRVRVLFTEDVSGRPDAVACGQAVVDIQPRAWTFRVSGEIGPLIQRLCGLPLKDIQIAEPRLEEILIKYYRENNS